MARKNKKGKEGDLPGAANPTRITPVEIQKKEFRVAMRGYHEQDVDQFLDDVTEEVARLYAENKRLREELEFAGTRRLDLGAAGEAEAMLRRAQAEADRILAEARAALPARSDAGPPVRGSANLGPFISRERAFLQSLADLIQSHAEAVKEDLRRARPAATAKPPGEDGGTATAASPGETAGSSAEAGASLGTSTSTSTVPESNPERHTDHPTQAWAAEGGDLGDVRKDAEVAAPRADPSEGGGTSVRAEASEPEIMGQDWTQYYSGPSGAMEVSGEDILDLTQPSSPRDATGEPYASPHPTQPMDDLDDEDRSIRELFWGED